MRKVIFPSAIVVSSELQSVGKLPAIVYPIDQKNMISLFRDHYFVPGGADSFEIVTYEANEKVARRIKECDNVHLWRLDVKKDIGYTVWYGLSNAGLEDGDTVIINFADVIVLEKLPEPGADICYYAESDASSKWTFFKERQGRITEIYDKLDDIRQVGSNRMFIGLFAIAHPKDFCDILEYTLTNVHLGAADSLYIALREYSRRYPFKMVKPQEWFDIGHLDKYYDAQLAIKSRSFNHITIDRSRGMLIKRSDDREKFINEIKWYLKLPADIEYIRPRIFSYSLSYDDAYVSMEYYAYHTLHELFLYGDLTEEQWTKIFRRIRFILQDMSRYTTDDFAVKASAEEMYLKKTLKRMEKMRENSPLLVDFDRPLIINGEKYLSLNEIMARLPELIKEKLLEIDKFTIIHGDLCFANMLVDSNYSFVKCIDPRGSFGAYDIYGDPRYELAKLLHSIEGKYDYIIKDLFEINCSDNEIEYHVTEQEHSCAVLDIFNSVFKAELEGQEKEIKLIEALLFISMIPLHTESKKHQLAMLATGIILLAGVTDIAGEQTYGK